MIKSKYLIRSLLVILLVSFSPILFAEKIESTPFNSLPNYYPEYFDNAAVLTGIDKKNSRLIFGSMQILYDQNVQINLLSTEFGTLDLLAPNMPIAFEVQNGSYKNGKIIQIWQLPTGAISTH